MCEQCWSWSGTFSEVTVSQWKAFVRDWLEHIFFFKGRGGGAGGMRFWWGRQGGGGVGEGLTGEVCGGTVGEWSGDVAWETLVTLLRGFGTGFVWAEELVSSAFDLSAGDWTSFTSPDSTAGSSAVSSAVSTMLRCRSAMCSPSDFLFHWEQSLLMAWTHASRSLSTAPEVIRSDTGILNLQWSRSSLRFTVLKYFGWWHTSLTCTRFWVWWGWRRQGREVSVRWCCRLTGESPWTRVWRRSPHRQRRLDGWRGPVSPPLDGDGRHIWNPMIVHCR